MTDFLPDKDAIKRGHEWGSEARDEGRAGVALDFTTSWCFRHLEPFRADWPEGAVVAMTELFKAFSEDERVIAMCEGNALRLAAVTHEHSPLCCFVGDDILAPIYLGLGKTPPDRANG